MKDFTFIVLVYNHAKYVIEHLESIKFLVSNYSDRIAVDIIVADDGSTDETVALVDSWFRENASLFRKISVLSDGVNRGTCANLIRAVSRIQSDYCKITAGDDVYSFVNLFREVEKIDSCHILSGLALNLIDSTILPTRSDLFNIFASNYIYRDSDYDSRLKRINFFVSPSVVYGLSGLLDQEIMQYVARHSVTEDYPLQIGMARKYRPLKFVQLNEILVYYRRTPTSTYLIRGPSFDEDKMRIFRDLIDSDEKWVSRLLLRNRLFCYKIGNRYLKRILNFSFWLYGFSVLRYFVPIWRLFRGFDSKLSEHQEHFDSLALQASRHHAKHRFL